MNDQHVTSLVYRVKCADWVDYSKAKPLFSDETAFRLEVKDKQARFELKEHYATEDEARKAVEDYVLAWNVNTCCTLGRHYFRLEFEKAVFAPGPQPVYIRAEFRASGISQRRSYPKPPSDISVTPDVESMYQRYIRHHSGREGLESMAYFCLSMLEDRPSQPNSQERIHPKKRKAAAENYQIDKDVLAEIGRLSSTKGGPAGARKASGVDTELTQQERRFLKEAIKKMIRRAAEKAHRPDADLPKISLADLPPI